MFRAHFGRRKLFSFHLRVVKKYWERKFSEEKWPFISYFHHSFQCNRNTFWIFEMFCVSLHCSAGLISKYLVIQTPCICTWTLKWATVQRNMRARSIRRHCPADFNSTLYLKDKTVKGGIRTDARCIVCLFAITNVCETDKKLGERERERV